MNTTLGLFDWAIIGIYLCGVVGLGVAAGFLRRKGERGGEGGHYFLAGNTLTWPVIGLAMFAANISTVHLVSLAETAYKYGLVFGNFEWMAGFTLILLSLFFAPLYLRSRVATLPDFLERRFNRRCRDVLSVVSLFSAIVIHIGVALYTAAWVLRGILGLAPGATILGMDALMFFIIVLGVLTGIYTMLGGLLAVVWTESVQTVLLLVGAVVITVVGYLKIGGWTELGADARLAIRIRSPVCRTARSPGARPTSCTWRAPPATPPAWPGIRSCSATRCSASGTGAATRRSCSACWRRGTRSTRASARCSAPS